MRNRYVTALDGVHSEATKAHRTIGQLAVNGRLHDVSESLALSQRPALLLCVISRPINYCHACRGRALALDWHTDYHLRLDELELVFDVVESLVPISNRISKHSYLGRFNF
jgi:hypothetical protein